MGVFTRDYEQAVDMYNMGASVENVAEYYGVTRQSMWMCLKRRGVEFRDNKKYGADNHFYRGTSADERAHDIIEKAVLNGKITRKTQCEQCGYEGTFADGRSAIQAHHYDYNRPLDVIWLCQRCHHEWHKNNRAKEVTPYEGMPAENIDIVFGGFPSKSPVNRIALRDCARALVMSVTCGRSSGELFARLRPDGSWEKTYLGCSQMTMDGSSEDYCGTWPKWGMLSDGACGAPPMLERRTDVSGCSSRLTEIQEAGSRRQETGSAEQWPTPRSQSATGASECPTRQGAEDLQTAAMWATPNTMDSLPSRSYEAMKRQATNGGRKNRQSPSNLREQIDPLMCQAYIDARMEVNNWATPAAQDAKNATLPVSQAERGTLPGNVTAEMWATPNAGDATGNHGGGQSKSLRTDTHGMGGVLNPDWVELLMGLPVGWTSPAGLPDADKLNMTTSRRASSRQTAAQDAPQD